jgi:hypothetical protein
MDLEFEHTVNFCNLSPFFLHYSKSVHGFIKLFSYSPPKIHPIDAPLLHRRIERLNPAGVG